MSEGQKCSIGRLERQLQKAFVASNPSNLDHPIQPQDTNSGNAKSPRKASVERAKLVQFLQRPTNSFKHTMSQDQIFSARQSTPLEKALSGLLQKGKGSSYLSSSNVQAPSVIFSSSKLNVTSHGACGFYSAVLSSRPTKAVTIAPCHTLVHGIRVTPSLLIFSPDKWQVPQLFRVSTCLFKEDHHDQEERKIHLLEHFGSSADIAFNGNRLLYVPTSIVVQTKSREGAFVFTSGQPLEMEMEKATKTSHNPKVVNSKYLTPNKKKQFKIGHQFSQVKELVSLSSSSSAPTTDVTSDSNLPTSRRKKEIITCTIGSEEQPFLLTTKDPTNIIIKVASRGRQTLLLYKSGDVVTLGKPQDEPPPVHGNSQSERVLASEQVLKEPHDMISIVKEQVTGMSFSSSGDMGVFNSKMNTLVDVECGHDFSVALTDAGQVVSWGNGQDGRLGHGVNSPSTRQMKIVRHLLHKRVVQIACGASHSFVLCEDGDVFSWGQGKSGALGHGHTNAYGQQHELFDTLAMPMEVATLKNKGVTNISCGDLHTVVSLLNGKVLTVGWTANGRLGRSFDGEATSCFGEISLDKKLCSFLVCGSAHTLVLADDKSLYAFGSNTYGQLGVGDCKDRKEPTGVSYFNYSGEDLVLASIAAGKFHSLALSTDSRVFGWGNDDIGQCGIGKYAGIYTIPHLIKSVVGYAVTQIAAGDAHSVLITIAADKHMEMMEKQHPSRFDSLAKRFRAFQVQDNLAREKVLEEIHSKKMDQEAEARKLRQRPTDPLLVHSLQMQQKAQNREEIVVSNKVTTSRSGNVSTQPPSIGCSSASVSRQMRLFAFRAENQSIPLPKSVSPTRPKTAATFNSRQMRQALGRTLDDDLRASTIENAGVCPDPQLSQLPSSRPKSALPCHFG